MSPASDEDLLARQSMLQDEAQEVLAGLDLAALVADIGPLQVTGSFVSGLMCWRELDVIVLADRDFPPRDVMGLLTRIVRRTGVIGIEYRDERGPRCVTGQVRDERYHVTLTVEHAGRRWQIDLTLWLHDLHQNVTRWHEELRERITAEQRSAVLRIRRYRHRLRLPASGRWPGDLHRRDRQRNPYSGPVRDLARPARPAGYLANPAACPMPPGRIFMNSPSALRSPCCAASPTPEDTSHM